MVDDAIKALDLLATPFGEDPTMAKKWEFYYSLFLAQFYGPGEGSMDARGTLENLYERRTSKANLETLQKALNADYDNTKQVLCEDKFLKHLGPSDPDPVEVAKGSISGRTFKENNPSMYASGPLDSWWYTSKYPPGTMTPTHRNTIINLPGVTNPEKPPYCDMAMGAARRELNTILWCPASLGVASSRLEDVFAKHTVEPGWLMDDRRINTVSQVWMHEMMHFVPELAFKDEPAVNLLDGSAVPNKLAYDWAYTVPLAKWRPDVALKNVENYVMFAKAVQFHEHGWDFRSGVAVRVEGFSDDEEEMSDDDEEMVDA